MENQNNYVIIVKEFRNSKSEPFFYAFNTIEEAIQFKIRINPLLISREIIILPIIKTEKHV